MALSDVKVVINLTQPTRKSGFGYPLIIESGATANKDYKECSTLAEVVSAGYENTTYVYKLANAIFAQDNAPKKIAVCSTNGTALAWVQSELNANKEWRQLIVADELTEDEATALSNYIETVDGKMLYIPYNETATSKVTGNKRTVYVAIIGENSVAHAAVVGASAGRTVGSFIYKNLKIKGITPLEITSADLTKLETAHANAIVTKAGYVVTSDGVTTSGEYIDIIDAEDYIIQQIKYRTQKLLIDMDKIPLDNNGISMLESVTADVLQGCYNNGMIATNDDGSPAYTVNFLKRDELSEADISARKYIGGQFTFKLAGGVHEVEITGEITV